MTDTVTYQSYDNPNPDQAWMAYVVMPSGKLWMVPSFAATEKEAVDKIVALWESERKKVNNVAEEQQPHHLAGLVWVINVKTREKKRVTAVEAEGLMAFGEWERGGPRSK